MGTVLCKLWSNACLTRHRITGVEKEISEKILHTLLLSGWIRVGQETVGVLGSHVAYIPQGHP